MRFSDATGTVCYGQNKRRVNEPLRKLLSSGISMRRAALILGIHRVTVAKKLRFLGIQAIENHRSFLKSFVPLTSIQFDDLETFEHTKLKPLSVTLAVQSKTRKILGFEVSQISAKGYLASKSREKYGPRKDGRKMARDNLFSKLQPFTASNVQISSDQNPHYRKDVVRYFPLARYKSFKGRDGCVTGQGELKRGGYDPLFDLNHTFAMMRANINRLFRRTWCTTKNKENLLYHIAIYTQFHNQTLT